MIENIQKTLNDSGLIWWVDSGSLLGLYRGGAFLPNDSDIDITIFVKTKEDCEKVTKAINEISELGFRCVRLVWSDPNYPYKYKMLPKNSFRYKLDIMICFVQPDGSAISPQVKKLTGEQSLFHRCQQIMIDWRKGNTVKRKTGTKNWLYYHIYRMYKGLFLQRSSVLEVRKLCHKYYNMLYWYIPVEFVGKISDECLMGYPIPEKTDEYLTYRYGNWKIPQSKWDFTTDDGAIREVTVEAIDKFMGV